MASIEDVRLVNADQSAAVDPATSGKQDTGNASLSSIKTAVETIDNIVSGTAANTKEQNQLVPFEYDFIDLNYTSGNLTEVIFKTGGAAGSTVATLTLAYASGVLDTVTRA